MSLRLSRAGTRVLALAVTSCLVMTWTAPLAASSVAAPRASAPLSMWVWSDGDPGDLVDFASEQDVDRLYVFVYRTRGAELARLQALADLADGAGIELWAMSGDPHWAVRHEDVLTWQRKALATGLFAGTHLDVEPHALPGWETRPEHLIRRYVRMLQKVQRADARALHVDVPYWYGNFDAPGGGETLADTVLEVVDGVTVMSYRDTATGPNSLSVVAEDMLARTEATGVPIELAVETNRNGCKHCTFYEEGADAMRDVIDTMHGLLVDHPTFEGFAVHDFDGFAALVDR